MKKIIVLIVLLFLAIPAMADEKIKLINEDLGVYVFKINTKKYGEKIKPYVSLVLSTPKKIYQKGNYDLVVNGGFFNVNNGKDVSYVVIDERLVSDVENNFQLISELKQQDRLEKVLSRSELRVLENTKNHKLKFDIARHNAPVKKGYKIKHSIQGGPQMLPKMDLAEEGFVVYENDIVKSQSADILKRRERTAVGIKGKYLYIVVFTINHRMDINEMRDYLHNKLRLEKAMALDGGLSTAFTYEDISVGSLGKYQRKVKSFIVIER